MTENETPLGEPRRELEWTKKGGSHPPMESGMWSLWKGSPGDDYHVKFGSQIMAQHLTLSAAESLANRLQRVLDGEPREPECPTKHTDPNGDLWADLTIWNEKLDFCPSCGASLKGTP